MLQSILYQKINLSTTHLININAPMCIKNSIELTACNIFQEVKLGILFIQLITVAPISLILIFGPLADCSISQANGISSTSPGLTLGIHFQLNGLHQWRSSNLVNIYSKKSESTSKDWTCQQTIGRHFSILLSHKNFLKNKNISESVGYEFK